MFGGMQIGILQSTLREGQKVEDSPVYRRFWAESPQARREKLMPFFWKTLMAEHGSIAGNPALESPVRLTNRHRFSYPGYAEILLGEPHDDVIKSNDPDRNPYTTVLEAMRERLACRPESSRDCRIMGALQRDCGAYGGSHVRQCGPGTAVRSRSSLFNTLQAETSIPWGDMRHDAFTFYVAMAQMATDRPRVLYLALGETDDWAHDGRYDRVLEAYARTDAYLAQFGTGSRVSRSTRDARTFSSRPIMGGDERRRIGAITARKLRAHRMCGLRSCRRRWLDAVNGTRIRRSLPVRSRRQWRVG